MLKPTNNKNKYSILFPYYRRYVQLESTLLSFVWFYRNRNDYEVLIAIDSKNTQDDLQKLNSVIENFPDINISAYPFGNDDNWGSVLGYIMLAEKARGDYFILTSPECVHRNDILAGMDEEFSSNPQSYVLCSCYSVKDEYLRPDHQVPMGNWYHHSVYRNVGVHFCSALHRDTYSLTGGFDPEYAKGICFDDDDFRNRVSQAGVPFVYRDDLMTVHLSHGSKPNKFGEMYRINREYYESIWGKEAFRAGDLGLQNEYSITKKNNIGIVTIV